MVPMMIETIYKRLAAADPEIPKAVLAEKVFGGKLQTILPAAHLDPYYIDHFCRNMAFDTGRIYVGNVLLLSVIATPENHKPGSIGNHLRMWR